MVTPFIFLTVSAFAIPLLENTQYIKTNSSCTLLVKEEKMQGSVILAITSTKVDGYKVMIYHLKNPKQTSGNILIQQPVDYEKNFSKYSYAAINKFYKQIDKNTAIYTTSITGSNGEPLKFAERFRYNGYRSQVEINGFSKPLCFIASTQKAEKFYQCANNINLNQLAKN